MSEEIISNEDGNSEEEYSGNKYLSSLLQVTTRQITRYREDKILPPVGADKDDIIKFLFDLVKNPIGKAELNERKIEEQIKKLQIENEIKLDRYVEKDKVIDWFRSFAEFTKSNIIRESENLESNVVCPPDLRGQNIDIVRASRNSVLALIASFEDFK